MDAAVFLRRHDARFGFDSPLPPLPAAALLRQKERPVSAGDPLVVAVHDPCHFRLDNQVKHAIREELASRPWIKLVELPDPGACCGGGGISSLKNQTSPTNSARPELKPSSKAAPTSSPPSAPAASSSSTTT